tara:strand:- start:1649 stop:1819 length:171 start_codon:yes stop_codon:yes gene_type:complete
MHALQVGGLRDLNDANEQDSVAVAVSLSLGVAVPIRLSNGASHEDAAASDLVELVS